MAYELYRWAHSVLEVIFSMFVNYLCVVASDNFLFVLLYCGYLALVFFH